MSIDLSTTYLGLKLKNPLVAAASPLTREIDTLRQMEDAGLAAAVLPSLFEEQLEHDELEINRLMEYQSEASGEALNFFPQLDEYRIGPGEYLDYIQQAKQQTNIPIIGSLNGSSKGGWVRYAKLIQDAGADALELNIYFVPTDASTPGAEVEEQYLELIAAIKESLSIPLALKMGAFFSSIPHFARRAAAAGAAGLVLFNRFLEPDIDLEALQFKPTLQLSTPDELRMPLRWIAILRDQVEVSLAATSGVHHTEDVIKALLAGADITMIASVLLQRGAKYVAQLRRELEHWLEENEYASVSQLKGSMSRVKCSDPSQLERANYMKALISYTSRV